MTYNDISSMKIFVKSIIKGCRLRKGNQERHAAKVY